MKSLASFIYTVRQAADGQYNCTILLNKTGPRTVFLWLDWSCQNNCRSLEPSGPHAVCHVPKTIFVYTCVCACAHFFSVESDVFIAWNWGLASRVSETLCACARVCWELTCLAVPREFGQLIPQNSFRRQRVHKWWAQSFFEFANARSSYLWIMSY